MPSTTHNCIYQRRFFTALACTLFAVPLRWMSSRRRLNRGFPAVECHASALPPIRIASSKSWKNLALQDRGGNHVALGVRGLSRLLVSPASLLSVAMNVTTEDATAPKPLQVTQPNIKNGDKRISACKFAYVAEHSGVSKPTFLKSKRAFIHGKPMLPMDLMRSVFHGSSLLRRWHSPIRLASICSVSLLAHRTPVATARHITDSNKARFQG